MKKAVVFLSVVSILCFSNGGFADNWYVPGDSATIQGAINLAAYGDTVQVAAGKYYESIMLKNGVSLLGAGSDATLIHGSQSHNVVTAVNCDPNTLLDGFNIVWGWDGGMRNDNSSLTVSNCRFAYNYGWLAGGIYNLNGAAPTIIDCTFYDNRVGYEFGPMGGRGGAIFNQDCTMVTVARCVFWENRAIHSGGGIYSRNSGPIIVDDCTFIYNRSELGAGIHNDASSSIVTNCSFLNNKALTKDLFPSAGGVCNQNGGCVELRNCIFVGNTGYEATALYNIGSTTTLTGCTFTSNVGVYATINSTGNQGITTLHNCIVWGNYYGNSAGAYLLGSASVSFSNIEDGYSGQGNIDSDPLFVRNPDHGESDPIYGWYEQDSEANDDFGDLRLSPGSPCIDVGNNIEVPPEIATDMYGYPRILDGDCNDVQIVDIGAYEFNYAYLGDVDYDCDVDLQDFSILSDIWHIQAGEPDWDSTCDISDPADDVINLKDLAVLCNNWLTSM